MEKVPKVERAMILQGGGSLGAYEAGAYKAAHQFIKYRNKKEGNDKRPIFDIIAGTSIGAINSAIITSYVVENQTWDGSAERLIDFWDYVSTESFSDKWPEYVIEGWNTEITSQGTEQELVVQILLGIDIVVFFVVLAPVALFFKVVGRDPMAQKFDANSQSYRVPSKKISKESMEKPF